MNTPLNGIIEAIRQAHDESLNGEHHSARAMLRDSIHDLEQLAAPQPAQPAAQPVGCGDGQTFTVAHIGPMSLAPRAAAPLVPSTVATVQIGAQPAAQGDGLDKFLALAEAAGYKTIHDVPGLMDALRATEQPAAQAVAADLIERICAAIKAADDKSVEEAGYMLDSNDCIKIVRDAFAAAAPVAPPAVQPLTEGQAAQVMGALVLARDGFISEAATGQRVRDDWREATVRKINVAIDTMQRVRAHGIGTLGGIGKDGGA